MKELIIDIVNESISSPEIQAFFIEYFSNFALSYNMNTLEQFHKLLSTMPKKKNDNTISSMIQISKLLAQNSSTKRIAYFNPQKAFDMDLANNIEAFILNMDSSSTNFSELLIFIDNLPLDIYNVFKALSFSIKTHNKKQVINLLNYLLNKKICVEPLNILEFKYIKSCKSDIVWYLWHLLTLHAQSKDYININMNLFTLAYQKKYRDQRLNILFYTFLIVTSKNWSKYIVPSNKPASKTPVVSQIITSTKTKTPVATKNSNQKNVMNESEIEYLKLYTKKNRQLEQVVAAERILAIDKVLFVPKKTIETD